MSTNGQRWFLHGLVAGLIFGTLLATARRCSAASSTYKNWGIFNDQAASHIDAISAWTITEGSKDIVVAVIDTGLDPDHQDLIGNVWYDENIFGWDFVTDTPNPVDLHGHGTHVAGIIGAVSHHVSIMPIKYYSDANTGSVNLRNTIKAIGYAVSHGARIINYSGGGPEFSEEEYIEIKKAEEKGVLFVTAAGNEHQDTDIVDNFYYPCSYRISNIVCVASTDINNNLLKSSNWGVRKVDVAAPGENIFSTLPGSRYGYMSGTSQATAFVSGIAALILSYAPALGPASVKALILSGVDKIPQLKQKVVSGGRVNAYHSLRLLSGTSTAPQKQ